MLDISSKSNVFWGAGLDQMCSGELIHSLRLSVPAVSTLLVIGSRAGFFPTDLNCRK